MPIYRENPEKLIFKITDLENDIRIKVDCLDFTVASVTFKSKTLNCGDDEIIDKGANLIGKKIIFTGAANNPEKKSIIVRHTIYENNGNELKYSFPNNYTGTPDYNAKDKNPTYKFTINFEKS